MPNEFLPIDPAGFVVGWTALLATYMIHSTVWIALAWLLTRPFIRIPFLLAHWLWKLALVGGIITSLLQVNSPVPRLWEPLTLVQPAAPLGVVEPAGATSTSTSNPRFSNQSGSDSAENLNWPDLVVSLWLAGAMLSAAWFAASWLVFLRRLGGRQPLVGNQLEQWRDQLCEASGIRHPILLTSSRAIASPVVLSRGEICLPERALIELTPTQQRSLLAHELAHIARHDPVWLFAAATIQCLFFFQPLNRLAAYRVAETGEYLCDDWALTHTGDGLALAHTLSQVASWASSVSAPGVISGLARTGSPWVHRVERALAWKPHTLETPRVWWIPLLAGLVAVVSCTVPCVIPQANPGPALGSTVPTAVGPIDAAPLPAEIGDALSVPSPTLNQRTAMAQAVSFIWPVTATIKINQQYWSRHPGIDVNGGFGVPVRAAASGLVVVARFDPAGYGNMIVLDHGSGLKTLYSHLESYQVQVGNWVEQGQLIAAVGSTGRSTGPHLHFAVAYTGVWQDPARFLPAP